VETHRSKSENMGLVLRKKKNTQGDRGEKFGLNLRSLGEGDSLRRGFFSHTGKIP